MKPGTFLLALTLIALAALLWRAGLLPLGRPQHHEPVEYYRGWGGYDRLPRLRQKITKAEAEAQAAAGYAYYIAHFDPGGALVTFVKMYRGALLFEQTFDYEANGRLKRATTRGEDGAVTVRDY